MDILTYNEVLTELCDNFDALISPRTIARSNTNVIYLLFKAFAKGWEVINNLCVALSNKFDPAKCTDSELDSVASLVGTQRLLGSSSGLLVTVVNNGSADEVMQVGVYRYALDDDAYFEYTMNDEKTIAVNSSEQLVFLSNAKGSYPVTAQSDIKITAVDTDGEEMEIPETLTFANADNQSLLGYADESNLAFRKRVLEDTDRQDIITELRDEIRSLPYVFDCDIKFNNTPLDIIYDGYTIPPFYMLVMVSGDYKSEIAEVVAKKSIYPTVKTENSTTIVYENICFANGKYEVNLTPYRTQEFSVEVLFYADTNFTTVTIAEKAIRSSLFSFVNGNKHTDIITDNDIFNMLVSLNLSGVKILGVELNNPEDEGNKNYIVFQKTRIPHLATATVESVNLTEA